MKALITGANSGEIWLPSNFSENEVQPIELNVKKAEETLDKPAFEEIIKTPEPVKEDSVVQETCRVETAVKTFEEMTVEELQQTILEKMRRNGPVTEQMKRDVYENVYHNSLVTWVKSFN